MIELLLILLCIEGVFVAFALAGIEKNTKPVNPAFVRLELLNGKELLVEPSKVVAIESSGSLRIDSSVFLEGPNGGWYPVKGSPHLVSQRLKGSP